MSNLSFVRHTGDGKTRSFTLAVAGENIGYFRTSDIHGYVDDVEVPITINPSSPHIVTFTDAPKLGADILIRRQMPVKKTYADFARGNNFGHRQVNNTFVQQLYLTQEILDGFFPKGFYFKNDIDLGGHRLCNVGDAKLPNDAVTKYITDGLDHRLNMLEQSVQGNTRFLPWQYNAEGGETELTPPYNYQSARLFINGVRQRAGAMGSYYINDKKIVLAEPLEEGDWVDVELGTEPLDYTDSETAIKEIEHSVNNLNTVREAVEWSSGLEVKNPLQLYVHKGVEYLPKSKAVPFTTGETFNNNNWVLSSVEARDLNVVTVGSLIDNFEVITISGSDYYLLTKISGIVTAIDTVSLLPSITVNNKRHLLASKKPTGLTVRSDYFAAFKADFVSIDDTGTDMGGILTDIDSYATDIRKTHELPSGRISLKSQFTKKVSSITKGQGQTFTALYSTYDSGWCVNVQCDPNRSTYLTDVQISYVSKSKKPTSAGGIYYESNHGWGARFNLQRAQVSGFHFGQVWGVCAYNNDWQDVDLYGTGARPHNIWQDNGFYEFGLRLWGGNGISGENTFSNLNTFKNVNINNIYQGVESVCTNVSTFDTLTIQNCQVPMTNIGGRSSDFHGRGDGVITLKNVWIEATYHNISSLTIDRQTGAIIPAQGWVKKGVYKGEKPFIGTTIIGGADPTYDISLQRISSDYAFQFMDSEGHNVSRNSERSPYVVNGSSAQADVFIYSATTNSGYNPDLPCYIRMPSNFYSMSKCTGNVGANSIDGLAVDMWYEYDPSYILDGIRYAKLNYIKNGKQVPVLCKDIAYPNQPLSKAFSMQFIAPNYSK